MLPPKHSWDTKLVALKFLSREKCSKTEGTALGMSNLDLHGGNFLKEG